MHGGSDEASAAERRQRAHAMSDRVATERDLGIAVTVEQSPARIAHTVEGGGGNVGRRDDEQRALCTGNACIDSATAPLRMGDAKLGHLRAKEREDGVRVVTRVLVDRDDLEAEVQVPEVLGGSPNGDPDGLFVIPERQDD